MNESDYKSFSFQMNQDQDIKQQQQRMFQIAKRHAKLNRIYEQIDESKQQEQQQQYEQCECCDIKSSLLKIELRIERSKLIFLGPGLVQHFDYLIFYIIVLILSFWVAELPQIIFNGSIINREMSYEYDVIDIRYIINFVIRLFTSCTKIDQHFTNILDYQFLWQMKQNTFRIYYVALIIFIRKQVKKLEQYYQTQLNISDYTVQIKGNFKSSNHQQIIFNSISEQVYFTTQRPLVQIYYNYNVNELLDFHEQIISVRRKFLKEKNPQKKELLLFQYLKKQQCMQQELVYIQQNMSLIQTNYAFVLLNSPRDTLQLLRFKGLNKFEKIMYRIGFKDMLYKSNLYVNGEVLKVIRSKEPDDYNFENINQSKLFKITKSLISVSSFCGILWFSYLSSIALFFGKIFFQVYSGTADSNIYGKLISLISKCSSFLTRKSVIVQGHESNTGQETNKTIRILMLNLYVTILVPILIILMVQDITQNKELDEYILSKWNQKQILVRNIYTSVFSFGIVNLVFRYMPMGYIYQHIRRLYFTYVKKDIIYRPQSSVNKFYKNKEFDLPKTSTSCLKIFFFCMTFRTMFPFATLIGAFILIIYYWLDKYLLLRQHQFPRYQDAQLFTPITYILCLLTATITCIDEIGLNWLTKQFNDLYQNPIFIITIILKQRILILQFFLIIGYYTYITLRIKDTKIAQNLDITLEQFEKNQYDLPISKRYDHTTKKLEELIKIYQ